MYLCFKYFNYSCIISEKKASIKRENLFSADEAAVMIQKGN